MENYSLMFLFLVVFFLLYLERKRKKQWSGWYIKNKKSGVKRDMTEYIKEFVGNECVIYLLSGEVVGTIESVSDKSMLIKTKTDKQIVNLDFVMRIREYPKDKKGKKKSLVID